jgi:hypothetical protein
MLSGMRTTKKTCQELAALEMLLKRRESGKCLMFGSRVEELERTRPTEQRTASFNISDGMGGCNVVTSDYLNEPLYEELLRRGLSKKDAHHITHAVCNNCDVFLTRDEKTIIKHRQWLEEKFLRLNCPRSLSRNSQNDERLFAGCRDSAHRSAMS